MKKLILSIITISAFNLGVDAQNVNIPDANFKAYLVGNTAINTNSDTEIQVSEATAFTQGIYCPNLGISDLTGIEAFININAIYGESNNLTSIDISNNTQITYLSLHSNNLTSLDVSSNTLLTYLIINNNNLTSLDISSNTNLQELHASTNSISSLDVSSNTALTFINVSINDLYSLDLSLNPNLTAVYCFNNNLLTSLNVANGNNTIITGSGFNATNNPNLTCIEVDDVSYSTANWTNIDATASFSLDCSIYVTSITVQGQGGATTITTQGGALQMEATVLPVNADDATYTWSVTNGTGSASIDASGILTAITNGTVTVTATANDASGVTGTEVITISNQVLSVSEEATIKNIRLYPNPATSQLTIDSGLKIESIEIMNVMGEIVKTIVNPSNTVGVSDLTDGVYFLKVKTDKKIVSKKFIKE